MAAKHFNKPSMSDGIRTRKQGYVDLDVDAITVDGLEVEYEATQTRDVTTRLIRTGRHTYSVVSFSSEDAEFEALWSQPHRHLTWMRVVFSCLGIAGAIAGLLYADSHESKGFVLAGIVGAALGFSFSLMSPCWSIWWSNRKLELARVLREVWPQYGFDRRIVAHDQKARRRAEFRSKESELERVRDAESFGSGVEDERK